VLFSERGWPALFVAVTAIASSAEPKRALVGRGLVLSFSANDERDA
jgi:hypothetical protein